MWADERLSKHFTLSELCESATATRCRIDNTPDEEVVATLQRLSLRVLEPAREVVNAACRVNSGYRCAALNRRVRGARHSAHIEGRAGDVVYVGVPCYDAALKIAEAEVPFDKLILEFGRWLHLQVRRPNAGAPRRLVYTASHVGRMIGGPRVVYESGLKNYW